jgi:hypothetical protein
MEAVALRGGNMRNLYNLQEKNIMINAWHCIRPNDYDAHMSHPNVILGDYQYGLL